MSSPRRRLTLWPARRTQRTDGLAIVVIELDGLFRWCICLGEESVAIASVPIYCTIWAQHSHTSVRSRNRGRLQAVFDSRGTVARAMLWDCQSHTPSHTPNRCGLTTTRSGSGRERAVVHDIGERRTVAAERARTRARSFAINAFKVLDPEVLRW